MNNRIWPEKDHIWLPAMFWLDHRDRALPSGELVKQTHNRVLVAVTKDELDEILNDAEYYCDPYGPDAPDLGSLRASAKRTVRAIKLHLGEDEAP